MSAVSSPAQHVDPNALKRRLHQRPSGLVLDDIPDEADEIDDRRLTRLTQRFGHEWHSCGNDPKRACLDLVRVHGQMAGEI